MTPETSPPQPPSKPGPATDWLALAGLGFGALASVMVGQTVTWSHVLGISTTHGLEVLSCGIFTGLCALLGWIAGRLLRR